MTEAKANKVENTSDAKVASPVASDTARDAGATLSTSIQDMMKEASGAGKSAIENSTPNGSATTAAEGISSSINNAAEAIQGQEGSKSGKMAEGLMKSGIGGKVAEGIINQHKDGQKNTDKSGALENMLKGGGTLSDLANFKDKVTDQDRKEAKEALEKGISGLVPEADRKLQVALQNSIIDGDMGKFQEAVKALGNDPEKLAKMVKEVNDQLNKNEKFGGVELSMDSKGNVLLYGEKGNTAVSVNPKTGDTTLRAVERQADGSVVLKDGEIINRTPAEVMKNLGDEATRSITEFPFHKLNPMEKPPFHGLPDHGFPKPMPKPGHDGKPGWNDKPHWNNNLKKEQQGGGHLDFTPLQGLDKESSDK